MTPSYNQGAPSQGTFKTELFDVTQGKQSVQNGALVALGAETKEHAFQLTFLADPHRGRHGDARRRHARQVVLLPWIQPRRSDVARFRSAGRGYPISASKPSTTSNARRTCWR
jgi:hypothetical protein